MALEGRVRATSRNDDLFGRRRPVAVATDARAEMLGQLRFVLLLLGALAAGSAAVASHWDLPGSWLVPQWLVEWLMPRVP
jgi:hypothetical protein